jgi:integrase
MLTQDSKPSEKKPRKKQKGWPKVVGPGHCKAKIYKTHNRGRLGYTAVWYEGDVRIRKLFADLDLAVLHATSRMNNLSRGEAQVLNLTGEQLLAFNRASEAVKEFGLSLDTVAMEYRDAKRLVRGKALVEVAQYYVDQKLLDIPEKTVSEVYIEMVKAKEAEGLSSRYIEDLKSRVGKFATEHQKKLITAVNGPMIKAWLQGLTRETSKKDKNAPKVPMTNRTRNNFRLGIQTLFSFAKGQRYLPADWKEMEAVPVWKTKDDEIEIFTPEEMTLLLGLAAPNLVPFLTIGAFAGLRSAEIERLDWSKVNLESGYITVDASIAKTNSRRLVPILPNLKAWLKGHKKAHGPVLELANVVNALKRLIDSTRLPDPNELEKLGAPQVEWKHNALRHSFCSYRMADVKSAAQVALEAGNSPHMIFQHYRELVTEKEGKAWYEITPDAVKTAKEKAEKERTANIVAFPANAAA